MQKVRVKRIDFYKGSGEALSFLPAMVTILMLLFFLVAFVQLHSAINVFVSALETVGRSVTLCSSFEDASEQAQRVADSIILQRNIDSIETSVTYAGEEIWKTGTPVVVELKAHIDTLEPFVLSRTVSKRILVTVEYDTRSANVNLVGNDNAEKIFRFFVRNGFSKEASAAIVGNCYQESGCNPESVGSGGCGIAGFKPASRLQNSANAQQKDWRNLSFQLDFLLTDIPSHWYGEASSQTAAYIEQGIVEAGISFADFKQIHDVRKAVAVFCAYYEQCWPYEAMMDVRQGTAEEVYRLYG